MLWDPYGAFQTQTLPNGLAVHALQMDRPWQRIGFLVHSGALQDEVGKEGTGHFLEHLVTENIPNNDRSNLQDYFRSHGGGAMLGATNFWYSKYSFYLPLLDEEIQYGLTIFAKLLMSVTIEKSIETERSVIINEFNKKYPVKFVFDDKLRTHHTLYKGMEIERMLCPLGTHQSINAIQKDDLQKYYDAHYTPANISVVGVGAYSLDKFVESIKGTDLYGYKHGTRSLYPPIATVPVLETNRTVINMKDIMLNSEMKNASIECSAIIPLSISVQALIIYSAMLSELLSKEIREERGWTYHIYCNVIEYYQFNKLTIECTSFSVEAIDSIEEIIDSIISSIPLQNSLFHKIRDGRIKRQFIVDENTSQIFSNSMDEISEYNRVILQKELLEKFTALTFEDICAVAPHFTVNNRYTVLVNP